MFHAWFIGENQKHDVSTEPVTTVKGCNNGGMSANSIPVLLRAYYDESPPIPPKNSDKAPLGCAKVGRKLYAEQTQPER